MLVAQRRRYIATYGFLFVSWESGEEWLVKFGGLFAGLALLKFRERIVSDPYDALKNWKDEDGVVNPCYWFGVECSDGKVVELYVSFLSAEKFWPFVFVFFSVLILENLREKF